MFIINKYNIDSQTINKKTLVNVNFRKGLLLDKRANGCAVIVERISKQEPIFQCISIKNKIFHLFITHDGDLTSDSTKGLINYHNIPQPSRHYHRYHGMLSSSFSCVAFILKFYTQRKTFFLWCSRASAYRRVK